VENIKLFHGDCLEIMKDIPDKSVDMILCDLPYGTTSCKWDVVIPLDKLWKQYERVIKDNGAIVLFGQQPFTTLLISSNVEMFRHNLIWEKDKCANFLHAKNQPRKTCEDIIVFSKPNSGFVHNAKNKCTYNPQLIDRKPRKPVESKKNIKKSQNLKDIRPDNLILQSSNDFMSDKTYPSCLVYFKTEHKNRLHPTQKPIALLEYLIKTYSNENEVVLDNCMGSGSSGIACLNTNRKFIGIELNDKYFETAKNRIENHKNTK
jgi:site-specific DNA-methyltransferase (adenine-specific)